MMPTVPGEKGPTVSGEKTRQGPLGRPVLIVLVAGLLLALVAWAGVEMWGEQIDTPAADDASGGNTDGT